MYFLIRLPPDNRYTIAKCIIVLIALQITLMQDEYLTSVSGYVRHICSDLPCISQLMFGTNLGRTHGPYGGGGGTFFEVNVEYDDIKGFFGYATTEHLTVFGVYVMLGLANPLGGCLLSISMYVMMNEDAIVCY